MDDASIETIVAEIAPLLHSRAPGKIFQLTPTSLAIDFGMRDAGYLFLSVEPALPRLYLVRRTVRELEKQGRPLTPFAQSLRKHLSDTRLTSIHKQRHDRIVRLNFAGHDELGAPKTRTLIVQLTGRSANLLLLDERDTIMQMLRTSPAAAAIGETYERATAPPTVHRQTPTELYKLISGGSAPSTIADRYFTALFAEKEKAARIAGARAELNKAASQQERLLNQLEKDLRAHENPEQHKTIGDLLLANLSTAKRRGNCVTLIDYFADEAPLREIEIDESVSLQEAAARRFALYAKSKRAVEQIQTRLRDVRRRLNELAEKSRSLEAAIAKGDFADLADQKSAAANAGPTSRKKSAERVPGTRRYLSTDGFEILVGRAAQDNDHLTFKVARPNDVWLHAADYGGSHVVVRNPTRKEIPPRTLIEAAQLAAYFSQAKKNPKADVHYTERKFVAKTKGGKPGLVRLQRFRTITVSPNESGTRPG
ncbi:MAG TPA: NFACT family protein [Pyrinomonadaceae bacterium]|nr:NFACT family protein [Pyrinomonadaceae bacterium]